MATILATRPSLTGSSSHTITKWKIALFKSDHTADMEKTANPTQRKQSHLWISKRTPDIILQTLGHYDPIFAQLLIARSSLN
mmetsp:Transcript_3730/g.9502  ORF Transcript_3730/g.9502 Transcript_3730/m.9502 type:complete len:82 (-) Transcript_3730:748-993(-)|eukprot:CAMPEP_0181110128 /NCGR_PEP_ID=MMETSP1071-20121207/18550_1 /TAXON_ID=35127 /ORGANISM="Thalassiosira sp., Strain NH16" /LENGTH=81 /DNA_ID=CAMNT_0023193881 /DNA_START=152 /DNA_END=397 /DNA_ORIENTATION=-